MRHVNRLAASLFVAACLASAAETALDRYVKAPDPSYRYQTVLKQPGSDLTTYLVELTSQTWRKASEIDRTEWKHWLQVMVPSKVRSSTGLLFITGGANDGKQPKLPTDLANIAKATGTVVAELRMVPNQPLKFPGESEGRSEDSFIVYTWDKFLRTGDETWPARLPMTKSAVRAMDTVTDLCGKLESGPVKVDHFVVSGASKRGWTTWTTAAVDKRVVAIIPIVIDVLNVQKSMEHHYRSYGFWAPAIGDYKQMGIVDWTGTPEYAKLMEIEDPLSYKDRLTMPKFIINASGDQFFLPDSSKYYFDQLEGEKYLRYVPNADHSLKGSDALQSIFAYYSEIVNNTPRPRFEWKFAGADRIEIDAKDQPKQVKLWRATNPKARDFRLEDVGAIWQSSILTSADGNHYVGQVEKPEKGWSAFFVELTYDQPQGPPIKLTSGVRVVPDSEPYPAYSAKKPIAGTAPWVGKMK